MVASPGTRLRWATVNWRSDTPICGGARPTCARALLHWGKAYLRWGTAALGHSCVGARLRWGTEPTRARPRLPWGRGTLRWGQAALVHGLFALVHALRGTGKSFGCYSWNVLTEWGMESELSVHISLPKRTLTHALERMRPCCPALPSSDARDGRRTRRILLSCRTLHCTLAAC